MQKRISIPLFFIGFFLISFAQAQVKIGDNPQTIDPASILELESSDKVLVITRVDSLQMTTIAPNRGALVYNTTADCVYYYDGAAWISMCEGADGGAHTATPIVNSQSTIVITPTEGGNNFEIAPNSITSDQILNGGINGVDIQNGSIGRGKLAPNAVDKARIAQNAVGPYAIDRDSLPLSFFNNDAGFITGANVVSGDADNDILVGSDSGAFFDATTLEDNIAVNTAAIAADGDTSNINELQDLTLTGDQLSISGRPGFVTIPTADGSDTNIDEGDNITITGNGTAATPYVINADDEVDGSITNELITGAVLNASNQLVITEAGNNTTVDLSSLAGGGGTADGVISNVVFTTADNKLTFTGTGGGFNGVIDLDDLDGGGTGTTPDLGEVLSEDNNADGSKIINLGVPTLDQDAATKKYVDDVVAAGGSLANGKILIGNATGAPVAQTISGDATIDNAGILTIEDDAIDTDMILDATIGLTDLSDMGATADGQILKWDTATTSWIVSNGSSHFGAENAIFFGDDVDGSPTDAGNELFWDPNAREENGGNFGALGIGLDGGVMSTRVKVHVAEQLNGKLSYPLEIQNRTNQNTNNSSVGLLFSVDLDNAHGKGALSYERTGAWGVGDFHFLQNTITTATNPTLTDKSFSIRSNKDIVLYNGIEIAGDRGDANQVLTSNGTGAVSWEDAGELSITDTDTDDALVVQADGKGYNIGVDDTTIEIISDALQVKDAGITAAKLNADVAGTGITQDATGALQIDPATITGNGDITSTSITVSGDTDALLGDVTLEIATDGVTAAMINADVAGTGIIQDATGALQIDPTTITGNGDITSTSITVGGDTDALLGDVTLEIATDGVTAAMLNADVAGTGITQDATGALQIDPSTITGNGDITSTSITVGGDTDALLGDVTLEIATDGVTAAMLNADVTGTGITQDANGALQIDPSTITGNGDITSTSITVSGDTDALLGDVTLEIAAGGVTADKIAVGAISGGASGNIAANSITQGDIGLNAIGSGEIQADVVGTSELKPDAVTTAEILNGTILDEDLAGSIDGNKIIPNFGAQNITTGGTILATGDITTNGDFVDTTPDYVFQKYFIGNSSLNQNYEFQTLDQVEAFIKQNHHLPNVKSALTIKKQGYWSLTESTQKNLEKIEELFLHTIEQEKEIKKLKAEKEAMANELKSMKNDIEEIKALLNQ
ncbi:beta strand repeat-containing protein [Zobellia alginiliquefaciens]|uniref:beta strand repeat-containing protein n=1 Tax=Zobellia alginiliquefaciens TaxID=3032586 RepID=UPI0023E46F40|nr:hypothetical protein [Zobellia alginiliquefaciens]